MTEEQEDWELRRKIYALSDLRKAVQSGLAVSGPRMIKRLTADQSLRELARRTGLSPTYLSMVKNGKTVISEDAFLTLSLQF